MPSFPPGTVDAAYLAAAATQTIDANAAAVSVLQLEPGARVLDVGCGAGDGFALLHAAGAVVVGADRDATLVRRAAERVVDERVVWWVMRARCRLPTPASMR